MNAVEIEQAITDLAEVPFDRDEFPFAFLEAFGNKATTIKKLRKGASNKSDVGGVLQTGNVHILTAEPGTTPAALDALKTSSATDTKRLKVRFLVATDGETFEAEDRTTGESVVCAYRDFPNQFGLFLPLAGISVVKAIRENAFDVRATSRLNRLYVQLLQDNPKWGGAERRPDLNHFFARLIFCFFAEDTDILNGNDLFTATVQQMGDDSNTHHVIAEIFRAMSVAIPDRGTANVPRWADAFPYVNGGLFNGSTEVPAFSKIARRYLIHIGNLDWKQINPDIFGSMIQAVADDEERSALGMHYTSVPNILKVLNPLFLDDLRTQLHAAGDNARKLLNLRKRMARIRVFDPACGSGNFLVIAYKEMRAIEAEVNARRQETGAASVIPLTNFHGIEIRDFSAEIARLALIITEYQCDVMHRGQMEALAEFLPLDAENWITCGNALRLDWLTVCPPTGSGVRMASDDLLRTPLEQAEVDFENEGGETYICGNPPYLGSKWQSAEQKSELAAIVGPKVKGAKSLDYVAGWFVKAAEVCARSEAEAALVATNSICQGQQVSILWPIIFGAACHIKFARLSFRWSNLASHNAGVTVAIVALTQAAGPRLLFDGDAVRTVDNINGYLIAAPNIEVLPSSRPPVDRARMQFGNHPYYATPLMLSSSEGRRLALDCQAAQYIRPLYGSREFINGAPRACVWISDKGVAAARQVQALDVLMEKTAAARAKVTKDKTAQMLADRPHRFRDAYTAKMHTLIAPRVSSEHRDYLPVGILPADAIVQDQAFALYDAPLWNLALIASRTHLVWIATVCGKLETRYRYSNTLGWNTFPVSPLTQTNKDDLTACAERILLTREAHFPATIADLYAFEKMPDDLRAAHDANDETLERIYIGRRFKNDTERLEHLFALYTKMTKEVA